MDNGRSETLMVDCGHFPTKLAATEAPSSLRPPNDGPRTRRRPLWVVSPMGSQRVNEDIRWGGSGSCSSGFRTQAPESYTDGSQAPALRTAMPPFHSGYPGPGSPPSLILGGSKVATSGSAGRRGQILQPRYTPKRCEPLENIPRQHRSKSARSPGAPQGRDRGLGSP